MRKVSVTLTLKRKRQKTVAENLLGNKIKAFVAFILLRLSGRKAEM